MRYEPQTYAQAFLEALEDAPEGKHAELARRLLGTVRKNGDWPGVRKILREVERLVVRRSGGRMIRAEFAREAPEPSAKALR